MRNTSTVLDLNFLYNSHQACDYVRESTWQFSTHQSASLCIECRETSGWTIVNPFAVARTDAIICAVCEGALRMVHGARAQVSRLSSSKMSVKNRVYKNNRLVRGPRVRGIRLCTNRRFLARLPHTFNCIPQSHPNATCRSMCGNCNDVPRFQLSSFFSNKGN